MVCTEQIGITSVFAPLAEETAGCRLFGDARRVTGMSGSNTSSLSTGLLLLPQMAPVYSALDVVR